MAAITKEQIKRVYALGSAIGIIERGNKNDDLHALVFGMTEKESISQLSDVQFKQVERELLHRLQLGNQTAPLKRKPKNKDESQPGMMSPAQQGLAWRMIYRLMELDERNSTATPGERMVGAIKKILGIEATGTKPFDWITFDDGKKLIEQLKRYVYSAELKAVKRRGAG